MNLKVVIAFLVVAILVLPLSVVQIIQTDSPQPFVLKARIVEKLAETLNGKLRFFLVDHMEGTSPGKEFVVTVDRAYTRGIASVNPETGQELWMQGNLMTREDYPGKQYLFFGYPQLYIRQIKDVGFWPDQLTELKILYLSPITSLLSPLYVWYYPFMEEYSLRNFLALIAKTAVIVTSVFLLIRNRHKRWNLVLIALVYYFLAMAFTVPVLTDMY